MKRILLSVFAVFLMGGLLAQTGDVTFTVNTPPDSVFNTKTDSMFITGSLTGWSTPGSVDSLRMIPNPDTTAYALTIHGVANGEIQYKYFKINNGPDWNKGEWGGDPNRRAAIDGKTSLNDTWGNKPVSVLFHLDISSIADSIYHSKAKVFLAGDLEKGKAWAMPGDASYYELKPTKSDTNIYTIELWLYKKKVIQFKYFLVFGDTASWSHGEWDGGDNRKDSISGADTLNSVWGDLGFVGIPTNNAVQPNFSFYPNPVHSVLYISNLENANRIEIFNVVGQKVREIRNVTGQRLTIQTGDLNNGIYVIAAFGKKGVLKSMKFIKQ
ncbi:MAG: T9SS type A sorting domain-containing protein [Chlorobi bacterium]|nr:T9SS type A sorting domain-containing protein [Chlorobiota bacterium]